MNKRKSLIPDLADPRRIILKSWIAKWLINYHIFGPQDALKILQIKKMIVCAII